MKTRILGVSIASLGLAVIGLLIQAGRMQGRQVENIDPPTPESLTTFADDASESSAAPTNSLAPFGSWIYVAGCGVCWQPTVCVLNHGWRPYCDRGRWVYTNCGWYWQSDYSWGWAAFHYGRWFQQPGCGWVWCPDRTWSPAWVSWRASAEYCGWAPLPPSAKFVAGSGFVYANHQYTFVPIARLSDYAPGRYAVASWQTQEISGRTKVITDVKEQNHRVVTSGVDPKQVSALAHTEIRQVEIRDTTHNLANAEQADRLTRSGGNLVIYRPQLPVPSSHVAGSQTYPTGSLVLRGNGQVVHSSTAPTTLASYTPAQPQPPYFQRQYTPVHPNNSTPNQGVSSVVISGRYTATQRSSSSAPYRVYSTGSPSAMREETSIANAPHVLPGNFTAAEHLNASPAWGRPSMEAAPPLRHNESPGVSETYTHVESHSQSYSAPATSHASSSSQSSGNTSNHK